MADVARKATPLQYENVGIPMAESQSEETVLSAWTPRNVKTRLTHLKKCALVARDLPNKVSDPIAADYYAGQDWSVDGWGDFDPNFGADGSPC
ncbi:hypothetical protein F5Y06DRAFT_291429 [Hypoxylon sp. FL0890]|nr:hypothetical protein F5Y06DRAFT_291429 [Hypoxylon sp. FL0890]